VHCLLLGSLAKLLFSFGMQSVLAFIQMVDTITGKVIHQWLLSWLKKTFAIPNSFMVLHQE
jgi:hypothetical protein